MRMRIIYGWNYDSYIFYKFWPRLLAIIAIAL